MHVSLNPNQSSLAPPPCSFQILSSFLLKILKQVHRLLNQTQCHQHKLELQEEISHLIWQWESGWLDLFWSNNPKNMMLNDHTMPLVLVSTHIELSSIGEHGSENEDLEPFWLLNKYFFLEMPIQKCALHIHLVSLKFMMLEQMTQVLLLEQMTHQCVHLKLEYILEPLILICFTQPHHPHQSCSWGSTWCQSHECLLFLEPIPTYRF